MKKGVSPRLLTNGAYFFALILYLMVYFLGKTWTLPYPLDLSFDFLVKGEVSISIHLLLLILWCMHYLRRLYEVNFVHIYTRRMSFIEAVGAQIYYGGFAIWISMSMQQADYQSISLFAVLVGLLLFATGEIGNYSSHLALRKLRTNPATMNKHRSCSWFWSVRCAAISIISV